MKVYKVDTLIIAIAVQYVDTVCFITWIRITKKSTKIIRWKYCHLLNKYWRQYRQTKNKKLEGKNNKICVFTRFKWHYASLQMRMCRKMETLQSVTWWYKGTEILFFTIDGDLSVRAILPERTCNCTTEGLRSRNRRTQSRILKKTRR